MKATIESTSTIVTMRDSRGQYFTSRVWQGVTEAGVEFTAYVAIAQVRRDADCSQFERELQESPAPNPATARAIDLRLLI